MRIVIAEDDPISRLALRGTLTSWGYEVVACEDGHKALAALRASDAPQLAILDWLMPGLSGVEVCSEIRRDASEPAPYLIILTAKDRKQDTALALESGADDYLVKPFDPDELRARLHVGTRLLTCQRDLIASRDELRMQATHDGLTGLWNRQAILDRLHEEAVRSDRDGSPFSVALIDLDLFKHINDTYGHQAGDLVLRQIAAVLRVTVRAYDVVGRYGGEEFLVVLPDCGGADALQAVERIRAGIAASTIPVFANNGTEVPLRVTASIGLATARRADHATDPDSLVREADTALYRAKSLTRNRVEVFAEDPVADSH